MRLIFMGTPDFACETLKRLIDQHTVIAAYTQPPRPAGRGKSLRKSPVHTLAESHDIPVLTPEKFNTPEGVAEFSALNADAAIVVAYGQILPQAALDAPKFGCFNLHASLLPRWRGAAPIQRAIMSGDSQTGNCIMRMAAGLDTGPVCAVGKTPIETNDTAHSLHDRLAVMGAELMIDTLPAIADGTATFTAQDDSASTYAAKIDKAEARVDWNESANAIDRKIRGLSPFPGAWTEISDERVKLLMSEVVQDVGPANVGTVLDDALLVKCRADAVRLLRLQRGGKGAANASDFLRGFPVATGTVIP